MKKETGIAFILIKDDGTLEHIELPFTIPPSVGDFISHTNKLGEVQTFLVTKRIFSEGTNNIIINFKNY
ncbi:hypothetical protein EBU24_01310 [bacterium]|nr:hypothetical protein [bacterium]